jgi:hypothetical protein
MPFTFALKDYKMSAEDKTATEVSPELEKETQNEDG